MQTIVAYKRKEVELRKGGLPLPALQEMVEALPGRKKLSMKRNLEASPTGIIAEFKRKSPSKGWLRPDAKVEEVLPAYERNGASACSVLTDSPFFGGSPEDLRAARRSVYLPLLRKDFIIDEYQLYEAKLLGADALLLIAAVLSVQECRALAEKAHGLGLEVLLEVHREKELGHLDGSVEMLGVNNRNLGTFHTDVANSAGLAQVIRRHLQATGFHPLLVAESGIRDAASVRLLRGMGYRGFLIGEAFMKAESPGDALAAFAKAPEAVP